MLTVFSDAPPLCYSLTLCRNVKQPSQSPSLKEQEDTTSIFSFIFNNLRGRDDIFTGCNSPPPLTCKRCGGRGQICSGLAYSQHKYLHGISSKSRLTRILFPSNNFLILLTKLDYLRVKSLTVYSVGPKLL